MVYGSKFIFVRADQRSASLVGPETEGFATDHGRG